MNNVIIREGIGYGKGTAAVFVEDKSTQFKHVGDTLADQNDQHEWALWGADNQEPGRLRNYIKNIPALGGTLHAKVRMAIGKGLQPFLLTEVDSDGNETLERLVAPEISKWLETNNSYKYSYENIYNLLAYGPAATQIVLSNDRSTINRIKAIDIFTARFKKKNTNGFIEKVFLHADWQNETAVTASDKNLIPLDALQEGYELADLEQRKAGDQFVMLHRIINDGTQYYPDPLWKSALKWAEISLSVPAFKKALFTNQMSIKYVVSIASTYYERSVLGWKKFTDEEKDAAKQKIYDDINDYLTGEVNSGKSIFAGTYVDPVTKVEIKDIQIEVVDDKMKDGRYLPDGAAADKQIMFAQMYNPAISGANLFSDGASGGAGSGSDIREAFLVQLMLMHAERMMNLEVFNLVKNYNGWARKYESGNKELVFRYANGILTTLDTGGSQKPIQQ